MLLMMKLSLIAFAVSMVSTAAFLYLMAPYLMKDPGARGVIRVAARKVFSFSHKDEVKIIRGASFNPLIPCALATVLSVTPLPANNNPVSSLLIITSKSNLTYATATIRKITL
jgi:hypothetical protein